MDNNNCNPLINNLLSVLNLVRILKNLKYKYFVKNVYSKWDEKKKEEKGNSVRKNFLNFFNCLRTTLSEEDLMR